MCIDREGRNNRSRAIRIGGDSRVGDAECRASKRQARTSGIKDRRTKLRESEGCRANHDGERGLLDPRSIGICGTRKHQNKVASINLVRASAAGVIVSGAGQNPANRPRTDTRNCVNAVIGRIAFIFDQNAKANICRADKCVAVDGKCGERRGFCQRSANTRRAVVIRNSAKISGRGIITGRVEVQTLRNAVDIVLIGNVGAVGRRCADRACGQRNSIDRNACSSRKLALRVDGERANRRGRAVSTSRNRRVGNADRACRCDRTARQARACRNARNRTRSTSGNP